MPHTLTTLVEGRLVYTELTGTISVAEVQQVSDKLLTILDALAGKHPVHVIINTVDVSISESIFRYTRIRTRKHPQSGWVIIVGESRLIGMFLGLYQKITQNTLVYCATPARALELLTPRDMAIANAIEACGGQEAFITQALTPQHA